MQVNLRKILPYVKIEIKTIKKRILFKDLIIINKVTVWFLKDKVYSIKNNNEIELGFTTENSISEIIEWVESNENAEIIYINRKKGLK
jgi:hypothetical protein